MAEQKFYDMTDTAENIDKVVHDLVEVVTEENDGKVLMVEKVVDEETEEVSVNIVEADPPVLEGSENEIVVFDGEGWGKESRMFAEGKDLSFFEIYPTFSSIRVINALWTEPLTVTNLIVTDITGTDEIIVYDMQTDENFSSLSTSTSPLYTSGTSTITLSPNTVTLPPSTFMSNNPYRYLGIRSSLFDTTRLYRINVTVGSNSHKLITDSIDDVNTDLAIASSNLISFTMDLEHQNVISGTAGLATKSQTILIGDRNASKPSATHFLALSGKSRITAHDNAALDMTQSSKLYMHDSATLNIDGSGALRIHDNAVLEMDHSAKLQIHDDARLSLNGSPEVDIDGNAKLWLSGAAEFSMNGKQNIPGTYPKVSINDGSRLWMSGDDSGSPDVAFNGSCKFFMNGDTGYYDSDEDYPTWSDPILVANKTQLMYCGSHSNVNDIGTPDNPTPYPFLSLERAKVMIGGPKYDDLDPTHGSKFWSSYPKFDGFQIDGSYTSDIVITSLIITDITDANNLEIIYNMQEDTEFENISTSSSPLFTSGTFTISTSPNTITFPAVASQTLGNSRFLGIRKNLFDTSRRYKINIICTPTTGTRSLNYIRSDGEVFATYLTGGASDINYTMPEKDIGSSTWIKIGTDEGNVQVHVLNNSFLQMSGNSHSEMHNDSFFIMKNRPENSVLEAKAKNLYITETGLLWEDLTEEEKLPWYKKADNGHEKVEGSPFFQMVNNSSIDLDDGVDITGDSSGLYLNNEKIATEYSYETEEEGETILNTVNIETLFTELQSALARITELEETIQTLNP